MKFKFRCPIAKIPHSIYENVIFFNTGGANSVAQSLECLSNTQETLGRLDRRHHIN